MYCSNPSRSSWRTVTARFVIGIASCGLLAITAFAQEPDPRALLKSMGDAIESLDSYRLSGDAYADARALASQGEGQVNLATLEQKIQSLNPRPARPSAAAAEEE